MPVPSTSSTAATAATARSAPAARRSARRAAPPGRGRHLWSALRPWLFGLFLVALGSVVAIARHRSDERALRDLPEGERRALYQRTSQTLAGPCAATTVSGALLDHCRHEAELLRSFAECDEACAKLAARYLEQPSR